MNKDKKEVEVKDTKKTTSKTNAKKSTKKDSTKKTTSKKASSTKSNSKSTKAVKKDKTQKKEVKLENLRKEEINEKAKEDSKIKLPASILVLAIILVILLIVNALFGNYIGKIDINKDIKKVKKIINEKYNDISCVDYNCDYVVAVSGNELSKTTYVVFSIDGKKLTQFSIDYGKNKERSTKIIGASSKYLITRTTLDNNYSYSLRNLKGTEKYSSKNKITILNDYFVSVIEESGNYKILDYNGISKYNNVVSYNIVNEGKYLFVNKGDNVVLLDEKGNELLDNYLFEKEVLDDNTCKYVIVRNSKTNNYNYFDIKKSKIVGKSFESYYVNKDNYIVIDKNDNRFYLRDNGRQDKLGYSDPNNFINIFNKLSKKINGKKYYAYSYGITSENQINLFVKEKESNTFGIYNIKTKKYKKLFKFKNASSSAILSNLESNEGIVKISCTSLNCDKELSIIYDLKNLKPIYKENNNTVISNYIEYNNKYKVVRYSNLSSNKELSGKYALYNSKNKRLLLDSNQIVVVDSDIKLGDSNYVYDCILYSSKDNKKLNNNTTLAEKIVLNDNVVYKYNLKNKKIRFILDKTNEKFDVDLTDSITYSNSNIIYMNDKKINIFNVEKKRLKSYTLDEEENTNDENGNYVRPYRGTVIVSDIKNKKVKILNSNARVLRTINNVTLSEVNKNRKGILLIKVKISSKNADKYGLYVAK